MCPIAQLIYLHMFNPQERDKSTLKSYWEDGKNSNIKEQYFLYN